MKYYIKIFGVLSCCVGSFFLLFACVDQVKEEVMVAAKEGFLEETWLLPSIYGPQEDSLLQLLTPILLSPPEDRVLEDWFSLTEQWSADYNDTERLHNYVDIAYNRFLLQEELESACRVKNAKGRLYHMNGQYADAIVTQQKALELAQYIKDPLLSGWVCNALGSSFIHTNDLKTARKYFDDAIRVSRQINYPALEAIVLLNLGSLAALSGGADSLGVSLQRMNAALEISEANDLSVITSIARLNISYSYIIHQDFEKAITFLSVRLKEDTLVPNATNTILYLNLYEAYFGRGDLKEAEHFLDLGCTMAEKANFGYGKQYCLQYRANLAEEQGNLKEAITAFLAYQTIAEEQTGLEASLAVESLKTRLRSRDKDLEIERLNEARRGSDAAYSRRRDFFVLTICILISSLFVLYFITRSRHQAALAEQQVEISETKLQALQSQMHPQFIFNALEGIQEYILKSEKIDAYNYLGKFATLLRIIAKYSTQVHIDLDQEINFIRAYLDMEKLRFQDDFVYSINVNPALTTKNLTIPSMVIQPVIENILINRFAVLDQQGKLNIEIQESDNGVKCVITDNGGGVKMERKVDQYGSNDYLSISSFNTSQRLNFLHQIGYNEVKSVTEDLYSDGQIIGVKVSLYLPNMDREINK